jgi:hypothetical protein
VALAALLAPSLAQAQYETGQWRVTPLFGVTTYDNATPFKTTAMLGGTVQYSFNQVFAAGLGMGYARPEVDGSYYPLVLFQMTPDTATLNQAGWQASQWSYYGFITVGVPLSNLYLYANGGVGGITTWWDRESFRDINIRTGDKTVTNLMIPVGVGLSWSVSSLIGIRIDAMDEIYTSFDRTRLYPAGENSASPFNEGRYRNTCEVENFCIGEANATPPEEKSTVHNFRFSLGFEFTPGR